MKQEILKELKSVLAGNGSAYDRMNAGQGGVGLPDWFWRVVDGLKKDGVTADNFDEKLETGELRKVIEILDRYETPTP